MECLARLSSRTPLAKITRRYVHRFAPAVVLRPAVGRRDPLQYRVVRPQVFHAALDHHMHQQRFGACRLPPVHIADGLVDVVARPYHAAVVQAALSRQRQGVHFARVPVQAQPRAGRQAHQFHPTCIVKQKLSGQRPLAFTFGNPVRQDS